MPGTLSNNKAASCNGCGTMFNLGTARGWNNRLFCNACLARADHSVCMNKDKNLRRAYGITLHNFRQLLEDQGGVCAICSTGLTLQHAKMYRGSARSKTEAVIDHCHVQNIVRGVLCHNCNIAVGHLQDSPKNALRAAHYLASNLTANAVN